MIKAALVELKKRISYREQSRQINKWTAKHAERLKLRAFAVRHDKWIDFIQGSGVPNVGDFLEFIWHWLFEEYPWAIEEPAATMPKEHPDIPNPIVPTILDFMSPGSDVQLERLKKLRGYFAAFRHSFVNHSEIMVMAMECGVDDDISKFRIEMVYRKKDGKEETEFADGHAISYEDQIMFFGRLVEIGAPFIFILSGLAPDTKNRTSRGHGTLLVGTPGVSSSAFPIVILRVEEEIEPSILKIDEFRSRIADFDEIELYLSKGKVWLSEKLLT